MTTFTNNVTDENAIEGISVAKRGVVGRSEKDYGIRGHSTESAGIRGSSDKGPGVEGWGTIGEGVAGISTNNNGVLGTSKSGSGVVGKSESTTGGAGVWGEGDPGPGVIGKSTKWIGVYGETAGIKNGPAGVWGEHKGGGVGVKAVSKDGAGLAAYSTTNEAIHAETSSRRTAAIAAYNLDQHGMGAAIFAKKAGTIGHAGFFEGNVEITGNLSVQGTSIQGLLQRIAQLEQQGANVGQLAQRLSSLEQKVAALQSQLNTVVSNLTGRITADEVVISDLRAKVQQIIQALGG